MFTRIIHTLVVLLSVNLFAIPAHAQFFSGSYSAGISVGYSTFSMEQMKTFQANLERDYPVDMKILEQFPGYLNFSAAFLIHLDDLYYGWVVGHTSTGGRIYYSDYTGHIASDQVVTMTYTGITGAKRVASHKVADLFVGGQTVLYFNKLKFVEAQKVYDENSLVIERFNSRNLALQVFLELRRTIKKFELNLHAGYEMHLPGQLLYQNKKDYYLVDSSNKKVVLDGRGLRTGVGVFYAL